MSRITVFTVIARLAVAFETSLVQLTSAEKARFKLTECDNAKKSSEMSCTRAVMFSLCVGLALPSVLARIRFARLDPCWFFFLKFCLEFWIWFYGYGDVVTSRSLFAVLAPDAHRVQIGLHGYLASDVVPAQSPGGAVRVGIRINDFDHVVVLRTVLQFSQTSYLIWRVEL